MIKGIHHVSLKCRKNEKYHEVYKFYTEVLGLKVARIRGEGEYPDGVMFDTGNGIIELFTDQPDEPEYSIIRHFALETDDTDKCADTVTAAGYEVSSFLRPQPSNQIRQTISESLSASDR